MASPSFHRLRRACEAVPTTKRDRKLESLSALQRLLVFGLTAIAVLTVAPVLTDANGTPVVAVALALGIVWALADLLAWYAIVRPCAELSLDPTSLIDTMTMTQSETTGSDRLAKQRLYRRLLVGFVVGGVALGLLLREGLGYPLVGEAVYWLGIVGFLAVWQGTSLTLFDERDRALERRASQLTLTVFAVVLVVGASTARILSYTDTYEVPASVWSVLWGYVALFGVFGVVYLWLRYRP